MTKLTKMNSLPAREPAQTAPENTQALRSPIASGDADMAEQLRHVQPESIWTIDQIGAVGFPQHYLEDVRKLADAIKASSPPDVKPIFCRAEKSVATGEEILLCLDGRKRLMAVMLAKSEGAVIETIPVLVTE